MIVLQGDLQQARGEFARALQGKERDLVTLLVVGDGPVIQQIAELAEIRALALPRGRRVIWITLPDLLTEQEMLTFGLDDPDLVVSVLNPQGVAVAQLSRHEAQSPVKLEKAFIKGQTT